MFLFFLCQGVSAAEVLLESGERIRARFVVLATGVSALFVFFLLLLFSESFNRRVAYTFAQAHLVLRSSAPPHLHA